nr:MAG TPA: hypothetical protein [Caudoviricetes sp.]
MLSTVWKSRIRKHCIMAHGLWCKEGENAMFEKFGKMTFDDLNRTAEGLKMEGDVESLVLLAEENGLEKEDAEDYADGVVDTLANPLEAAMGKIKVESEHLNLRCSTTLSGMRDLVTYMISRDEEMQVAVHDPEKSLAKCLGKLVAEASRTRYKLPDEIAIAAGIPTVYMGDVSKERAKEIIKAYYGGEKA